MEDPLKRTLAWRIFEALSAAGGRLVMQIEDNVDCVLYEEGASEIKLRSKKVGTNNAVFIPVDNDPNKSVFFGSSVKINIRLLPPSNIRELYQHYVHGPGKDTLKLPADGSITARTYMVDKRADRLVGTRFVESQYKETPVADFLREKPAKVQRQKQSFIASVNKPAQQSASQRPKSTNNNRRRNTRS